MHGLLNRSMECFLSDTYGSDVWLAVVKDADIGFEHFEAMFDYPDSISHVVLEAAAKRLLKSPSTLLEDMGTYLVSSEKIQSPRRLLRFGGATFDEFLHSLDDLYDRAKLAVPELELPRYRLLENGKGGEFKLICTSQYKGFGRVTMGVLRAMADDYGALVFMEYAGAGDGYEEISIALVESSFSEGRYFSLVDPIRNTA